MITQYANPTFVYRLHSTLCPVTFQTDHVYIYIYKKVKLATRVEGNPKLLHQGVGESATPFPGLLHFSLDPYLIMLSVKQGGIKYHFLRLWYDSIWDWTPISRTIGEHSTH